MRPSRHTHRRRLPLTLGAGVAALALVAAGCGSSNDNSSSGSGSSSAKTGGTIALRGAAYSITGFFAAIVGAASPQAIGFLAWPRR